MSIKSLPVLVFVVLLAACGKKEEAAPPVTAPAAPPSSESAAPAAPNAMAAPATAPDATVLAKGEEVFTKTCTACHQTGITGAPKIGDQAAWSPRIAQGKSTLYQHAIHGFTGANGTMPPKGGNSALSDDEVQAAVDFMVSKAQ
jgi:cytochrome c5